ncbi:Two component transcriptional regulator, winged helix family [Paraburkholderia ribeironis]|uniref:Two component transcriptional regulator, winged helix family n=1 Tax=Paraburkholderia ribeironis TaxID=1247936 RepID=A0A1N7S1W9_9BURK|nr:response regulator transcription factor [Paraburkholderia ribeironis]SIT41355.1 Two component transcriptional regulator, winged helix family [Paraburkholderia ribeironis]
MRIAILEDDPVQAVFVANALSAAGHGCHQFARGQALVHALRRETFDLLILDWEIPDMTGKEVLQWIKKSGPERLPVIFMTAYGREDDITSILDAGADDYLVKPVGAGVLLARVSALLRRVYAMNPVATKELFGEFEFDLPAGQVSKNGVPVPLTQREFALALLLFQNLGRPLSRAHVAELVWRQAADVPSRTMDTHISCLRTKLGLRPENGYRLAPIYGYGYRLEQLAAAGSAT